MIPSGLRPLLPLVLACGVYVFSGTMPAAADWLVIRDGSRVETRGAWSVEGERVVFTRPNGTLSALRLREVDLEASQALTRAREDERRRQDGGAVPDRAPPRWTLTNDDIPEAAPPIEEVEIEPLVGAEGFELIGVRETVDATGTNLMVQGTLINSADIYASDINIRVLILSPEDGGTLGETAAVVSSRDLPPGSATVFSASFINVSPGLGVVQVEVRLGDDEDEPFELEFLEESR